MCAHSFPRWFSKLPRRSVLSSIFSPCTVLLGRSQFVQVGEDASDCCRCLRGVPQGSKLGPLLYNFYTSDLPSSNLTSSIILYADDVCLMTSHTSYSGVVKSLQHDVSLLSSWYDRNSNIAASVNYQLGRDAVIDCNQVEGIHHGRLPQGFRFVY